MLHWGSWATRRCLQAWLAGRELDDRARTSRGRGARDASATGSTCSRQRGADCRLSSLGASEDFERARRERGATRSAHVERAWHKRCECYRQRWQQAARRLLQAQLARRERARRAPRRQRGATFLKYAPQRPALPGGRKYESESLCANWHRTGYGSTGPLGLPRLGPVATDRRMLRRRLGGSCAGGQFGRVERWAHGQQVVGHFAERPPTRALAMVLQ